MMDAGCHNMGDLGGWGKPVLFHTRGATQGCPLNRFVSCQACIMGGIAPHDWHSPLTRRCIAVIDEPQPPILARPAP